MGVFTELDWTAYTTASLGDQGFGEDLTSKSLTSGVSMASWVAPVHRDDQIPMDNSYISYSHGSHFGSMSSELSQSSLGSLPALHNTDSDNFSTYQSPVEPLLTSPLSFPMPSFHQILNGTEHYRVSVDQTSSNGSISSAQEYPCSEYLTAKEKSILHRRKQNRAAQRTFRQRKEQERQELQCRLDEAVQQTGDLQHTCSVLNVALSELRSRVKSLEGENTRLREKSSARARQSLEENEGARDGNFEDEYE